MKRFEGKVVATTGAACGVGLACVRWLREEGAAVALADSDRRPLPSRGPITSSFAESAVNQVVSKRFVKRQQMAWRPALAHLFCG